jgi:hypothetical protein
MICVIPVYSAPVFRGDMMKIPRWLSEVNLTAVVLSHDGHFMLRRIFIKETARVQSKCGSALLDSL